MGYAIGFDNNNKRYIGYGVPAICEHPGCNKEIDRGVSYACNFWYNEGCGRFFCSEHLHYKEGLEHGICEACENEQAPFPLKPEHPTWIKHILKDLSWKEWRKKNKDKVIEYKKLIK